jgi:hypothetical protein
MVDINACRRPKCFAFLIFTYTVMSFSLVMCQYLVSDVPFQVHPKDVNRFQQAYCNVLKGNMDGLKKLKKTKTKAKAT